MSISCYEGHGLTSYTSQEYSGGSTSARSSTHRLCKRSQYLATSIVGAGYWDHLYPLSSVIDNMSSASGNIGAPSSQSLKPCTFSRLKRLQNRTCRPNSMNVSKNMRSLDNSKLRNNICLHEYKITAGQVASLFLLSKN